MVLVELAHDRAGDEVVAVHGHDQGAAVRGVEQRSHGLQQAHRDPARRGPARCGPTCLSPARRGPAGLGPAGLSPAGCRAPLADVGQLLPQRLLQCQGQWPQAGVLPPRVRGQWEKLGDTTGSSFMTDNERIAVP